MSKSKANQKGGYQSSDDYEMQVQISKPSSSKPSSSKPSTSNMQNAPPLPITNQFNTLSNFPELPYSQVVRNQSNLTKAQKQTEELKNNSPPTSGYCIKQAIENMCLTPFKTSPPGHEIRKFIYKTFPQNFGWLPDITNKTQRFYEFILVDSGSAEIKHEKSSVSDKVMYSKCIINKVICSDEWIEPYAEKTFSKRFIPQTYSYFDYKQAWFRTFLFQEFDHSWFISFNKHCPKKFPIWFYNWWYFYGPTQQIYPPICIKGFETFVQNTKGEIFSKPLLFHAEFKIPWIFCWSFTLHQELPAPYPLSLVRQFKIKWWNKFMVELCSPENVLSFIQTGQKIEWGIKEFNKKATSIPSSSKATLQRSTRSRKKVQTEDQTLQELLNDPKIKKQLLKALKSNSSEDTVSVSSSSGTSDVHGGSFAQDPYDF